MGKQFLRRILRNYRGMAPGKFHVFNQGVKNGLTEHPDTPASACAANPTLLTSYFAATDKHDALYHEATYGSKLVISQREIYQAQLTNYLDEIASMLEAATIRNPEALLATGFDLTKERRSSARAKTTLPIAEAVKVNTGQSV